MVLSFLLFFFSFLFWARRRKEKQQVRFQKRRAVLFWKKRFLGFFWNTPWGVVRFSPQEPLFSVVFFASRNEPQEPLFSAVSETNHCCFKKRKKTVCFRTRRTAAPLLEQKNATRMVLFQHTHTPCFLVSRIKMVLLVEQEPPEEPLVMLFKKTLKNRSVLRFWAVLLLWFFLFWNTPSKESANSRTRFVSEKKQRFFSLTTEQEAAVL